MAIPRSESRPSSISGSPVAGAGFSAERNLFTHEELEKFRAIMGLPITAPLPRAASAPPAAPTIPAISAPATAPVALPPVAATPPVVTATTAAEQEARREAEREEHIRTQAAAAAGDGSSSAAAFLAALAGGSGTAQGPVGSVTRATSRSYDVIVGQMHAVNRGSGFINVATGATGVRMSDAELRFQSLIINTAFVHEASNYAQTNGIYAINTAVQGTTGALGAAGSLARTALTTGLNAYAAAPASPGGASFTDQAGNVVRAVATGVDAGFNAAGAQVPGQGQLIRDGIARNGRGWVATRTFELLYPGMNAHLEAKNVEMHPNAVAMMRKLLSEPENADLLALMRLRAPKLAEAVMDTSADARKPMLGEAVTLVDSAASSILSHLTHAIPSNPRHLQATQLPMAMASFRTGNNLSSLLGETHIDPAMLEKYHTRGLVVEHAGEPRGHASASEPTSPLHRTAHHRRSERTPAL